MLRQFSPVRMAENQEVSLNQVVADALRKWMADAGPMSQAQLARAASVPENDVSRLFKGRMKKPSLDFLDALARVFKRRIFDLFADVPRELPLSVDEVTVLAAWHAMKLGDERDSLLRLLRRGERANPNRDRQSEGSGPRQTARKRTGKPSGHR